MIFGGSLLVLAAFVASLICVVGQTFSPWISPASSFPIPSEYGIPYGVALDDDGSIFVSHLSTGGSAVISYMPAAFWTSDYIPSLSTVFTYMPASSFTGVQVVGNFLVVVDFQYSIITVLHKLDYSTAASLTLLAPYLNPVDCAFYDGKLYVTFGSSEPTSGFLVFSFNMTSGNITMDAGYPGVAHAYGIAVDSRGVFIGEAYDNNIIWFSHDGELIDTIPISGSGGWGVAVWGRYLFATPQVPVVVDTPSDTVVIQIGISNNTNNNNNSTNNNNNNNNDNSSTPLPAVLFDIGLKEIREIGSNDKIVQRMIIANSLTVLNIVEHSNGTMNITIYGRFTNGADLAVDVILFTTETTIVFANQTVKIAPNSLKYSVRLSKWPFASVRNQLGLILQSYTSNSTSVEANLCSAAVTDESESVVYYFVRNNDQALYGKMVPTIELDGGIKIVKTEFLEDTGDVIIYVPHFWDQIDVDPNYSILLTDSASGSDDDDFAGNCNTQQNFQIEEADNELSAGAIAGTVVGVIVGVAVITAATLVIYPKVKLWVKVRKDISRDFDTPDFEPVQHSTIYNPHYQGLFKSSTAKSES